MCNTSLAFVPATDSFQSSQVRHLTSLTLERRLIKTSPPPGEISALPVNNFTSCQTNEHSDSQSAWAYLQLQEAVDIDSEDFAVTFQTSDDFQRPKQQQKKN